MTSDPDPAGAVRVVFADANVLYSRVLRDYLLYAADEEIIAISWSASVLAEMVEHLADNVAGFTAASGVRLIEAMNRAFPYAQVDVTPAHTGRVAGYALPDEDDRHVLAGAVVGAATVLCTSNVKDFPTEVTAALDIEVMTPDALLAALIAEFPTQMRRVHATSVKWLRGATDASTIAALRRAGAPSAATLMAEILQ